MRGKNTHRYCVGKGHNEVRNTDGSHRHWMFVYGIWDRDLCVFVDADGTPRQDMFQYSPSDEAAKIVDEMLIPQNILSALIELNRDNDVYDADLNDTLNEMK